jgi:hypothetical protein
VGQGGFGHSSSLNWLVWRIATASLLFAPMTAFGAILEAPGKIQPQGCK